MFIQNINFFIIKGIIKQGGRVSLHQANLTKVEQVEKLINDVKKLKSMWVGLINNAGITYNSVFQMSSEMNLREKDVREQ